MSATRDFRAVPAQRKTYVRLFRSEPGQIPEVVGSGRFAVSYGEPVDVVITDKDGIMYVPAESWDCMRGEWACTAKPLENKATVASIADLEMTRGEIADLGQVAGRIGD